MGLLSKVWNTVRPLSDAHIMTLEGGSRGEMTHRSISSTEVGLQGGGRDLWPLAQTSRWSVRMPDGPFMVVGKVVVKVVGKVVVKVGSEGGGGGGSDGDGGEGGGCD